MQAFANGRLNGKDLAPINELVKMELSFKVKKIACGYYHILILTEDNELYGCGSNSEGQLGLGDFNNRSEFTKIENPKFTDEIKAIECGGYYSTILTKNNSIYLTGQGACGQLGFNNFNNLNIFTKSDFNFGKIKLLRCVSGTTIVFNERGVFYLSGCRFTQMDAQISEFEEFYCNADIIDFKCGYESVVMLDKFGQLFFINPKETRVVHWPTPFKIKQISCSLDNFMILNENNELYVDSSISEKKLKRIKLENDIQVKRLCSGLREEGCFVSTKGTIHYIEYYYDKIKQIKTDNLFKDELFIYPNIGNDFIYVITSKNPLFEEEKDKGADKMLNLLFKQQQQLTDQYSKFIDTEFLFH